MTASIAGLREIADRFDHVLLDQWGTVHEGKAVFPEARDCIRALRAAGKRVLILSNSGKRSDDNAERLAKLGLPAKEHDGVLTSGEVLWHGLQERAVPPFNQLGRRALLIGSNVLSMVEGLDVVAVTNPMRAEFVWLASLDETNADPEAWRDDLESFAARRLPMLCANPDLTMFTSKGLLPAPGRPDVFLFRYWPSGELRIGGQQPRKINEIVDKARRHVVYLERVRRSLGTLLHGEGDPKPDDDSDFRLLGDVAWVLPPSPPWQFAMVARDALKAAESGVGVPTVLEDHLRTLQSFSERLPATLRAVGHVMRCAWFLVGVRPSPDDRDPARALEQLSLGLNLKDASSDAVERLSTALQQALASRFGVTLPPPPTFSPEGALEGFQHSLREAVIDQGRGLAVRLAGEGVPDRSVDDTPALRWRAVCAKGWASVLARSKDGAVQQGTADVDELLCHARGIGAGRLLSIGVASISLAQWSALWTEPLGGGSPAAEESPAPMALIVHALSRCGLACLGPRVVGTVLGATSQDVIPNELHALLTSPTVSGEDYGGLGLYLIARRSTFSITETWTDAPRRAFMVIVDQKTLRDQAGLVDLLKALPVRKTLFWEPGGLAENAALDGAVHAMHRLDVVAHPSIDGDSNAALWSLPSLKGPGGANEFILAASRGQA